MKKIFIAVLLCFPCLLLFGCSKNSARECVSEVRDVLYRAENASLDISFSSGLREDPFDYDGIHSELVEFGILSVSFLDKGSAGEHGYKITLGETVYEGTLEKNPYENVYMADIKARAHDENIIVVIGGDEQNAVELVNVSQSFDINVDKAIEIGLDALSEKIEACTKSSEIQGEVYVKIIFDKNKKNKDYFWYLSFLDRNGEFSSVVISPSTGEVLARI